MSAVLIERWDDVPPVLQVRLEAEFDETRCEAPVTCLRQRGDRKEAALIGLWLDDDDESPVRGSRFTPFVLLNTGEGDPGVLVCEDCAAWLTEALAAGSAMSTVARAVEKPIRDLYGVDIKIGMKARLTDGYADSAVPIYLSHEQVEVIRILRSRVLVRLLSPHYASRPPLRVLPRTLVVLEPPSETVDRSAPAVVS